MRSTLFVVSIGSSAFLACGGRAGLPPPGAAASAPSAEPGPSLASCAQIHADELTGRRLGEPGLLSALGRCEEALLARHPGLRSQVQAGASLIDLLLVADVDGGEALSYGAMLSRFMLAGGPRRELHYGPRLAALFQRTWPGPAPTALAEACHGVRRDIAVFLVATPRALGGDPLRGGELGKGCDAGRSR